MLFSLHLVHVWRCPNACWIYQSIVCGNDESNDGDGRNGNDSQKFLFSFVFFLCLFAWHGLDAWYSSPLFSPSLCSSSADFDKLSTKCDRMKTIIQMQEAIYILITCFEEFAELRWFVALTHMLHAASNAKIDPFRFHTETNSNN